MNADSPPNVELIKYRIDQFEERLDTVEEKIGAHEKLLNLAAGAALIIVPMAGGLGWLISKLPVSALFQRLVD